MHLTWIKCSSSSGDESRSCWAEIPSDICDVCVSILIVGDVSIFIIGITLFLLLFLSTICIFGWKIDSLFTFWFIILILDFIVYSLWRNSVLDLQLENYGVKIFSSDSGVTLSLNELSSSYIMGDPCRRGDCSAAYKATFSSSCAYFVRISFNFCSCFIFCSDVSEFFLIFSSLP